MSYKFIVTDLNRGDIAHAVVNNNQLQVVDLICQCCYQSVVLNNNKVEVKDFNYSEYKDFVCFECSKKE